MFEVMMYDGGVYRSAELFEAIEEAMRGTKELQEFLARFC